MDGGCDNGRGAAAPVITGCVGGAEAPTRELDAGQPSRARSTAATGAHCIGVRPFVEFIFMCTSSVLALESS
jgi:hypothetical protein